MKKTFIILIALVSTNILSAQSLWELDSTITPLHIKIDSIFANVDLSTMQTNFLIDKSFLAQDPQVHNGVISEMNKMDKFKFQSLYYTMMFANKLPYPNMTPFESILPNINLHNTLNTTSIGIMAWDYDRIKSSALEDSLLRTDGSYLYSIPFQASPFEKKRMFAASIFKHSFDTSDITFTLKNQFTFSNINEQIASINIDFGDGNGYVNITPEFNYNIHYSNTGKKVITVKLILTNQTELNSETYVYINRLCPSCFKNIQDLTSLYLNFAEPEEVFTIPMEANEAYLGKKGKANVTIAYGCGNRGIRKPLIIVPGIDHKQLEELEPEQVADFESFVGWLRRAPNDLMNNLQFEGYDLIYIDYEDGADYIQRNAKLVESVIQWVNTQKINNGSTEPTSILGISMGGVVARYALAEMESNNQIHDVEKFVSFDAPHNGANIPLGAQAMLWHAYDTDIKTGFFFPIRKLHKIIPQIELAEGMLSNPATRQLLLHHLYSVDGQSEQSLRTTFMLELNSLGWPSQISSRGIKIDNISISSGNGSGTSGNQGFNAGDKMLEVNSNTFTILPLPMALLYSILGTGFITNGDVWAMPSFSSSRDKVYSGFFGITVVNPMFVSLFSKRNFKVRFARDIDNAPGGISPFGLNDINNANIGNQVILHNPNFCHIPSISSADLKSPFSNNLYHDINSSWNGTNWSNNQSEVDKYLSGFREELDVNGNPLLVPENQTHCDWTDHNSRFFIFNALNSPLFPHTSNNSSNIDNFIFNFGGNSGNRLSSCVISNGGEININSNTAIGFSNLANPLSPPANGSFFSVRTNGSNCNGNVIVEVRPNSALIIGDNSTNNTGELIIGQNDRLILEAGSKLVVNNNSKLIIEEGAILDFRGDAEILLQGENALIEVRGTLELGVSSNFTVSKGSANTHGYIKFITVPNAINNARISTNGTNSTIILEGNGRGSNKILEIEGPLVIPNSILDANNYVSSVIIKNTSVEIDNNGSLDIGNSNSEISYVLIKRKLPNTINANGLITHGQSNLQIDNVMFNDLLTGITVPNPNLLNPLLVTNSFFNDCENGIISNNSSIEINDCHFEDCGNGLLLNQPNSDCIVNNSRFSFCDIGVHLDNTNSNYPYFFISNSSFYLNTIGCEVKKTNLNISCTNFMSNNIGLSADEGSLNLSTSNTFTGTKTTLTAGNNTFINNHQSSVSLSNFVMLYINNGYNNFFRTYGGLPVNYIVGSVAYSSLTHSIVPLHPLLANNNYWNPAPSPNLNSNLTDYYNLIFPFPGGGSTTQNQMSGNMLTAYNDLCYFHTTPCLDCERKTYTNTLKNENVINGFNISTYPNPINTEVNINIEQSIFSSETDDIKTKEYNVILYTIDGKELINSNIKGNKVQLNTKQYANGIYFLKVSNLNYSKTIRIIIEN